MFLQGKTLSATVSIAIQGVNDWQNPAEPDDVDGNGAVTPLDVLRIITTLNLDGARPLPGIVGTPPGRDCGYYDVNGDNLVTPLDVLLVIQRLNTHAAPEGEGVSAGPGWTTDSFGIAASRPGEIVSWAANAGIPTPDSAGGSGNQDGPTLRGGAVGGPNGQHAAQRCEELFRAPRRTPYDDCCG